VLPGVRADGVYLGGLSQTDAKSALDKAVAQYATTPIAINYNNSNLRLTPDQLGTTYDTAAAAKLAVGYGRAGNLFEHIHAQLRALFSRDTNVAVYNYDSAKLALALQQIDSQVAAPVQDAVLSANTDGSTVTPAQDGMRLDNGRLAILLGERLAKQDSSSLKAPARSHGRPKLCYSAVSSGRFRCRRCRANL
jgi:vancomycin resistance protein YoaR